MNLILRLDVDKPYGNHTFFRKVLSKFIEETDINLRLPIYLDHVKWMIQILKLANVKAIFYFRNCTVPNKAILDLIDREGHAVGFHAENTRSLDSFAAEVATFKKKIGNRKLHSFTKHGSGKLKLGKNHFPRYEPIKYLEWANIVNVPFFFGNDLFFGKEKNINRLPFYSENFWIETNYRKKEFETIESLSKINHQVELLPIITHPENLIREGQLLNEFKELCEWATKNNCTWLSPEEFY